MRAHEIMEYAETQLFLYNLLLMKLIDDGDYKNVTILFSTNLFDIGKGIFRVHLLEIEECELENS